MKLQPCPRQNENLANCLITKVFYNFMPILDWISISLNHEVEDESKALRFEMTAFAAFELYI
ncbi:MAG: mannonate dehydratase [Saprospiraceae bacterium]|nr:mannonate dehydratase [Saprospiraceae bacterium]